MDTKALRQKILDLAIRGKLVPQDPNDEPASVLLERIRAEKQQMVKDGKLKAKDIKNDTVIFKGDDNLHYEQFADGTVKCIEDEIPFELPEGWTWARLGVICPYGENKAVSADLIDETAWILDLEDIEKETGVIKKYTTKSERNSVSNKYSFCKGQLLYSKLRPYLNKVVIATKDGYCTTEILPLTFYGNIYSPYMQLFIMSPTFLTYVNMISYGVKMPRLGTNDGKNAIIAIPPINEQKRIRDKFDIVAPLFDKIQNNLNNLNNEVTAIKSKILDLAIRGKLVPQNPNDEPASILLERIQAEKEELIKQGKIKRDKKESVIFKGDDNSYYRLTYDNKRYDVSAPFDLPDCWEWTTFPTVAHVELGKTLDKVKNTGTYYPYLRSVNVQWGYVDLSDVKEMKFEPEEIERYTIKKNDLLICEGGDVGRCCVWNKNESILYQNAIHRVRFYNSINCNFYMYFMMYLEAKGTLKRISNGVTIKHLTNTVLSNIIIPLPPLAEQERIVNAVETLFAQIDKIAEQIS